MGQTGGLCDRLPSSLSHKPPLFISGDLALLTILQLIRLRKAWRESALAMDQIKEYFIRHTADPHPGDAFR
jgi:hypothetical protein